MIDQHFYLIAAYCVGAINFAGFAIFFMWREFFLRRQVKHIEKKLFIKG